MKLHQLVRSPRGTGVRSEEFWNAPSYEKAILLAVLFIPFQYALTVHVGFPLKISEVLVVIAVLLRALRWRDKRDGWSFDQIAVGLIAVCVVLSTVIAVITLDPTQEVLGLHRSHLVDTVLYFGYAVFVLVAWWLLRSVDARLIRDVLFQALWLCAAAVAFQAVCLLVGAPHILDALGFDSRLRGQEILGVQLARSGPFLEGQHLGFFAGALVILALYSRRWPALVVALACAAYSQSTTAVLGIVGAVVLASLLRPNKRILITLGAVAAAASVVVAVVKPLRDAVIFQLAKLGLVAPASDVNFTQSLDIRTIKTEIGWRMMWDNPLGVGPGRFAANFPTYWHDYELPTYYYTTDMRAITENVYMHIGAENGVVAFLAFVALLVWILVRSFRVSPAITALALFTAIAVSTQSSWTFLPIWVVLAYLTSAVSPRAIAAAAAMRKETAVTSP